MDVYSLVILFFSAFLGGMAVFLLKQDHSKNLKLLLSFSGAYLFAITVLHLIPNVYQSSGADIGLYVLLGFGLQIFLEQFSQGAEHGHIHHHQHSQHRPGFPLGIMISLSLHAFLEGMPLAHNPSAETHDHQHPLLYGIALHHIPAAFALSSILVQHEVKKSYLILLLIIFALMTPAGMLLSASLQANAIGNISAYFDKIMATVIGMFLHISTTILFESSVDHRFNQRKMIAILLGTGIAILYFIGS